MRTGVIIGGRQYFYDLYKVVFLTELYMDDELLVVSPISDELCRVRVEDFTETSVKVQEMRDGPSGIFWKISNRDISRRVYKINY